MRALTINDSANIVLGLQEEIHRSGESRYDHRLHGVLLVAQGMTCPQVAELLGDSRRTVEYWVHRFEGGGLGGLREGERPGRPRRLSDEQLKLVSAALRLPPSDFGLEGHLWDGKLVSAYVGQQLGVRLGVRQCQRLFRQFRFRLRKPRPVIAHADPAEQAVVKKLCRLAADDRLDLWSLDEVHFQQYGSRCRMWVPPENRDPVLLHHPTRRSVGYFGAVRLRDGRFLFRRETERFGAETFFDFLVQLHRATRATRRRLVLILDNATYHHARLHQSWREAHADRLRLEFLPPYSPKLNPIERVWKFTRRKCLHNRYFPQLERVIEEVEWEFTKWARHSETLRRLCAII